jgi:hypothetical protein
LQNAKNIAPLLDRIAGATLGGIYNCQRDEVYNIYEEITGNKLCRKCSSDLIYAYNYIKKYAREMEIQK